MAFEAIQRVTPFTVRFNAGKGSSQGKSGTFDCHHIF